MSTTAKLALTDLLPLPNSPVKIPRLGFGVYQSHSTQCTKSCLTALQTGYRHIDTAQYYQNEAEVGHAVRQSGIPRKDVFITTKILSAGGSPDATYRKCRESVTKIDGEEGYVDLFLIHSPSGGPAARKEMWQALEKLVDEGKAKSIGVSNYGVGHIEEMREWAKIWPPHVNQIEVRFCSLRPRLWMGGTTKTDAYRWRIQLHPWCQQRTIVSYCHSHSIVVEAYSPLVRNHKANDSTLLSLAKAHGKTTAQVLIRYCLQKNWVPLPKSDTESRIKENADVYGFELSSGDMEKLDALDMGDAGAIVQAVTN